MIIETKFDINQEVYIIHYNNITIKGDTCLACAGGGMIKLKDSIEYACPSCRGMGYRNANKKNNFPRKISFHAVTIDSDRIPRYISSFEDEIPEKYIYATQEECQVECDKLNGINP